MSNLGRQRVIIDENGNTLIVNSDGSINVQSRPSALTGIEPIRVQVGIAATLISAANSSKRTLELFNNDTTIVYIGFSSSVSIITGTPLFPYTSWTISGHTEDVYVISTVANTDIRVTEQVE